MPNESEVIKNVETAMTQLVENDIVYGSINSMVVSKHLVKWEKSPFHKVKNTSCDTKGWVGECMVNKFAIFAGLDTVWDGNTRFDDSIVSYDLMINNRRVEVKTATVGVRDTWQHEHLHPDNDFDFAVFVDFDFNDIYFTVFKRKYFDFDNSYIDIINRKMTPHVGGYKITFTHNTIKQCRILGLTSTFSRDNEESVTTFFKEIFS